MRSIWQKDDTKCENIRCKAVSYKIATGRWEKGIYEICGYSGPRDDEDLFLFLKRLSKLIDDDIKKVNCIKKLPAMIRKFILFYERNCRIEQYLNRKYLSEEERLFWRNKHRVTLCNL